MQSSNQVVKEISSVQINPEQWKDTVVLMSNSELDGFREGDADLIDKVLVNLHQSGIVVCRVVASVMGAPVERLKEVESGQLIPLTENPLESHENLQKQLLKVIDDRFKGKKIIFYIGSRGDLVDPILHKIIGSGSLFDIDLMRQLKARNVKIVVCCLEYKFFKRSRKQLDICYQMLRHHLFFADSIQFLTQHDLSNFIKTMEDLKSNPILKAHRLVNVESNLNLQAEVESIGGIRGLENLKRKGVFVSGIFTVSPLLESDILASELAGIEKNPLKILCNRPLNVLCFGMIRPHKGFEQGIELAKIFEKYKSHAKVYIVGGVQEAASSCTLMRKLLVHAYGLTNREVEKIIIKKLIAMKNELGVPGKLKEQINENMKFDELAELFAGNKQNLNIFFQSICDELAKTYRERNSQEPPVIFKLNITDDELKKTALKCKYAVKLDHKGMANNASTIISCLGLYLPTFTAVGLLTGNEFRNPEIHRSALARRPVRGMFGEFKLVVFMPPKIYNVTPDGEVQPSNFQAQQIYDHIMNDSYYEQRIHQISLLHQSGQFDARHAAQRIVDELLVPNLKPASENVSGISMKP